MTTAPSAEAALAGKVAVVTGTAHGIGAGIADALRVGRREGTPGSTRTPLT